MTRRNFRKIPAIIAAFGMAMAVGLTGCDSPTSDQTTTPATITFNGNQNTAGTAPTAITVNVGDGITLPGRGDLVRSGYAFVGWRAGSPTTGTVLPASSGFTVNANITMYAAWNVMTPATIYFEGNGHTHGEPPGAIQTYIGVVIQLPVPGDMASPPYFFSGWRVGDPEYGSILAMGVNFEVTGDETLYAVWAPYTVTFDDWAGSVTRFEVSPGVDISGMRINLIIPPITHAGYPVTSIDTRAFQNIENLVGIEIPAGVTYIGSWAFSSSSIETVTFAPDSQLQIIATHAFHETTNLTSIEIPAGVTSIGEGAFLNSGIETVTFAPDSQLQTIRGGAFQDTANLVGIEIPATVTSIGWQAFLRSGIETVTFAPNSQLQTIERLAFLSTTNLTSIEIPAGVTSIGDWVFNWPNQQRIYIHHDTLTPYGWHENWRGDDENPQIYNASVTPPVRLFPFP